MSRTNLEPTEPRIVKKKKISAGHHGGAWKVAYADFVTAMMALFIVLWIMSQSQSIRQSVAQYFKNPGILTGATGVMETSDMGGSMPTPGHSQELQTPAPINPEITKDKSNLEEVKKRIEEMIAQLPELQKLKEQVLMEITSEGLRIELLERDDATFFDIGSANLKPETKKILSLIAQELGGLPNKVTVEGHTDSRPYGNQSYTNWELSTDRANAARRFMETTGLKTDQIFEVRGFADRHLRNIQNPLDCQNRRVSIIVVFQTPGHTVPLGKPETPVPSKTTGAPGPAGTPESPKEPMPQAPSTPSVPPISQEPSVSPEPPVSLVPPVLPVLPVPEVAPKLPEKETSAGKVPSQRAQPDEGGRTPSGPYPVVDPAPPPLVNMMIMKEHDAKEPEPGTILNDELEEQLKPLKPQTRLGW